MSILVQSNVKDPDRVRARHQQIIDASVQLFTKKGFHKTTTREIARASGISIGALYEYVKTKEDILFLVCQHIHKEVLAQLTATLAEEQSGAKRLTEAIKGFYRVVHHMQDQVLLIYQESKSLPAPFLHEVLNKEQGITDVFAQLIQLGVEDGSLLVDAALIPLIAHDIVVTGQMWAFRRWALRDLSLDEFVSFQTTMILTACGVHNREAMV